MNFREFVQMLEAGGLWGNPGVPYEGGSPVNPNNCDIYNGHHCGGTAGGSGGGGGGRGAVPSIPTAKASGRAKMMKKK